MVRTPPAANAYFLAIGVLDDEASCLATPGCAFGDAGEGPVCFFVGDVEAQSCG